MMLSSVAQLSDVELFAEVQALAAQERHATARLIASLAELDERRLYLAVGCSSLFTYCTQVLRLSEHAAYGRIAAARAVHRFPLILDLLTDGAVNLTTVCLIAPHLTAENHRKLLHAVRHKTKREVEQLVAAVRPQPDVASSVRKLPAPKPAERLPVDATGLIPHPPGPTPQSPVIPPPPTRPAIVAPLAPERYKVQFTVSRETFEKLRRAQDLLRHAIPNGDPAALFDRALTLLIAELERTKLAATSRPRSGRAAAPSSRHIAAPVKREVWARDGAQCAFVGTNGRCTERGFLEFHHVVPYATGGASTAENLELRCRAHNAYEAAQYFGPPLLRESAPLFW